MSTTNARGKGSTGNCRPVSLRAQAVAWLAQREYSVSEMRRKLLRRLRVLTAAKLETAGEMGEEFSADRSAESDSDRREVDDVIEWLLENRHLDETRFLESRVRVRSAGRGVARIAQELSLQGLELPAEMARELRDSEFERALAVWQRRFGEQPADARAFGRQARFLAGRGFSADVVTRILRASRAVGRRTDESR